MKNRLFIILWRIALLLLAVVVMWSIISVNTTEVLITRVADGDPDALDQAIVWGPTHPRVQALQAGRLIESGLPEQAEPLLVASVMGNPADAKPLMLLAEIRRQAGDLARADQMAETADRLMPVDARTQRLIASYWYERGRLDLAVPHLSVALSSEPAYRDELFPIFLQIAETRGANQTLKPIAEDPPKWWDSFAAYAIRNTENLDSLRALAQMRRDSKIAPITDIERNAYINRLKKDGLISEAYLLWVSGLDSEQKQALGYLYNGGFELPFSNTGFGWYAGVPRNSGVVISTATTYGIVGKKALYLSFRGKRIRFSHLRQSLRLEPGVYRFSGRVRPDKLRARKGLQWLVSCAEGASGTLGQSTNFLGTSDWREFEFDIQVPTECVGQLLQLRSIGNRDVDHELNGEIWFDDLRIHLQREPLEVKEPSAVEETPEEAAVQDGETEPH